MARISKEDFMTAIIDFNNDCLYDCIFYISNETSDVTGLERGIIKVKDDFKFVDKVNLILSDKFYQELEKYFGNMGYEVSYNNVRDTFWLKKR